MVVTVTLKKSAKLVVQNFRIKILNFESSNIFVKAFFSKLKKPKLLMHRRKICRTKGFSNSSLNTESV